MKKLLGILLALALLLGCTAAFADPITLTYAEVNPVPATLEENAEKGSVVSDVAWAFKTKLEELSAGEIVVDLQGGGVMGPEKDVLANILGGDTSADIVRISAFALNQYGAKKSVFLTLPYVFGSEEHYWKFVKSDLAKEMLAEAKEVGQPWTGLAYGEEGYRHFFSKVDIKTIEDLKGLKIRVSDDPIMTGLQTGVVDCAEQPITNYLSNSFQEVAPYMLRDGHTLGTIELIATDSCFDKLSDEQKAMVQEAADYAMAECEKSVMARQEDAYNKLIEMGCTVNEVEDKSVWQEATKAVLEANIAGMEEIYEAIMALQ